MDDSDDQPTEFADRYRASLTRYVDAGHERQLEEAYSLGRAAFAGEVSILDLLAVHRDATQALLRLRRTSPTRQRIAAGFEFLAEALATYEMVQRGYSEAHERARLEREQTRLRRRLTEAYMTVDRAMDLPDTVAALEAAAAWLLDAPAARCYLSDLGGEPTELPPNHAVFTISDPLGKTTGLLAVDTTGRPPLSDDDRFLLTEFGHMAGVAIENARQFDRERSVALMLQQDLLPAVVPRVAGLDVAVRYLPGEADTHAGGDWYDVFAMEDGRVGLVVGDTAGHGVTAAAAMGQLRIAVLAYALAGNQASAVVERVDDLLTQLGAGDIATLVYAVANPTDGELVVVNAGHPPPLVIEPDGSVMPVLGGHGRLLGVERFLRQFPEALSSTPERMQHVARLRAGGHLLLYTDGLIEPVERSSRDGVARLCEVTEGFAGTADQLCDLVLERLAPDGASDDICIVAATLEA